MLDQDSQLHMATGAAFTPAFVSFPLFPISRTRCAPRPQGGRKFAEVETFNGGEDEGSKAKLYRFLPVQ